MMEAIQIGMGAMVGFAYVAPPGPVNVETLRRGLTDGRRAALAVQVGVLAGDAAYALLAALGAPAALDHPLARTLLNLAGCALLLYLGYAAIVAPVMRVSRASEHQDSIVHAGVREAMIALLNPCAVVFWLSIGGILGHQSHPNAIAYGFGFGASTLLWTIGLPIALSYGQRALTPPFLRAVSTICGLTLIGLGVGMGWTLVVG